MTAIDLNRAGVPLIEIVGEPEIRSSAQAGEYLRALKEILVYAEVSECSMEEGSLRVDANVSARPQGDAELRPRTEIKNLNSFSNVQRALELEFARHVATYEAGGTIAQQTMLYDAESGEVRAARSKEGSHDYRYFPEPDLPPLLLDSAWLDAQRAALPELPAARRARFASAWALSVKEVDALTADRALAEYFEATAAAAKDGKLAANWVLGEVLDEQRLHEHLAHHREAERHLTAVGADDADVDHHPPDRLAVGARHHQRRVEQRDDREREHADHRGDGDRDRAAAGVDAQPERGEDRDQDHGADPDDDAVDDLRHHAADPARQLRPAGDGGPAELGGRAARAGRGRSGRVPRAAPQPAVLAPLGRRVAAERVSGSQAAAGSLAHGRGPYRQRSRRSSSPTSRTTRAGTPITTARAGTSRTTTAPAAT
jgi:hypothetical protein